MNSILYVLLVLMIILLVIVLLIATIYTKLIKFNRIIKEIEKVRDSNMTKISNCFAMNNTRIWENRERIDEIIKVLVGSLEKNKDVADKIRSTNENVQRIYDFVHIDSIDKTNKLEEICKELNENITNTYNYVSVVNSNVISLNDKLDNISQQIAENNKANSSSIMD